MADSGSRAVPGRRRSTRPPPESGAQVGTAATLASDRAVRHTHLLAPGTVIGGAYTILVFRELPSS